MVHKLWFWCLLLLVLAGCGGGAMKSPAGSPSPYRGGGVEESAKGGADYSVQSGPASTSVSEPSGMAPMSPPPPPSPAHADSSSWRGSGGSASAESHVTTPTPPRERPGLGTEWGETRESHVRDVTFFRADPERPFAVASFWYNDRSGVEALAAYRGGSPHFREMNAGGGAITVSIRNAYGEPFEGLRVGDRTYVVGAEGERYTLVLTNHTGHRFEAVATVDGLDVINGRPGTLSSRGYVLMPYATLEIDGFRQSSDAVAAFRFAKVADSYAAQTGSARNVGVIGIAFFSERGDVYSEDELHLRDSANPFPGSDPRYARPPR